MCPVVEIPLCYDPCLKQVRVDDKTYPLVKRVDSRRGVVKYYLPMNFPIKAVPIIFGADIKITREWGEE